MYVCMHIVMLVLWLTSPTMYVCTVGEPITSCPADPTVCPSESNLKDISQIGFWMEGAEGDFFFELQSVRAGNGTVF